MKTYFHKYYFLCLIGLFFNCYVTTAQELKGVVLDVNKKPVFGATITLNEKHYSITNSKGSFSFKTEEGTHVLKIEALGFVSKEQTVKPNQNNLVFILKKHTSQLKEVVVYGGIKSEKIKKTGYAVEVVNLEGIKNSNTDINQVLKSLPGVNLREVGGLGSGFNLSLNGLSGNQVRYFMNGIPMENFGSSFNLNNFPVNQVENIEVYKGVVPISLGADALGGAINIITGSKKKSILDASYSFGSFNTHRASLVGQYFHKKSGFFIKSSSFFNHSDNDYLMKNVPVFDLDLGNPLGEIDVKRFHDQYTSGMTNLELGVLDKKYADELTLNLFYAGNRKNYQHPDNNILRTFGEFHATNKTVMASSTYKKKIDKLKLKAYVVGGRSITRTIDTSSYKYNWAGDFILREASNPKGELNPRKSLFNLQDIFVKGNIYSQLKISEQDEIGISLTHDYLKRTGEDEVDVFNLSFQSPNYINKSILGAEYSHLSKNKKFRAVLFGKKYFYSGEITSVNDENTEITTNISLNDTGYGGAISYSIIKGFRTKFSIEQAYRIPESYEILGDGIYVTPNILLEPEESLNMNLGFQFKENSSALRFSSAVNLFYRDSKNFIRLSTPRGPFGAYENLRNVNSKGIEGSLGLNYQRKYMFNLNLAYQDITDQTAFDDGFKNDNYQSKVPNIPYLFGNTRLGVRPLKRSQENFVVYWHTRFVYEFFRTWENLGDSDGRLIIPEQLLHDLEMNYSFDKNRYNLSLLVNNIFDELAYDNFRIQKPGRAVSLKLRYLIE